MLKQFIIVLLAAALSPSSFAADSQSNASGLLDAYEKTAVKCKLLLDIAPYIQLVSSDGVDEDAMDLVTPEIRKAIVSFEKTGMLSLPASIRQNPKAQNCIAMAEGMMTGHSDNSALRKHQVNKCKPHFDIDPYLFMIGSDAKNIAELVGPAVTKSLEKYEETGLLNVPTSVRNDPKSGACVAMVEGILMGDVVSAYVVAMGEAIIEAFGRAYRRAERQP